MTQAEVRFGHTYGQLVEAQAGVFGDLRFSFGRIIHAVSAVYLARDDFDLFLDRQIQIVKELEIARLVGGFNNSLCQFHGATAALFPMFAHFRRKRAAFFHGGLAHQFQLRVGIGEEFVHRHHHRHAVFARQLDVMDHVGKAGPQQVQVLIDVSLVQWFARHHLGTAAVHLQRADGRHQHHHIRDQAGGAALDVKEFLHAHVGAEARFRHHVISQLERDLVSQDGAVAVRNIGERPGMHEDRCAFQRLHQVGFNRVAHQHRHRARNAQVAAGDGLAAFAQANHDAAKSFAHILQAGGQRQHGHDFAGHGDVKARLAFMAGLFRSLADRDAAQEAVARIDHAPPGDGIRVDVQAAEPLALFGGQIIRVIRGESQLAHAFDHQAREAPLAVLASRDQAVEKLLVGGLGFVQHTRIDGGCHQVVGRGDGVNVAGQVQVELFHGNHLAVAAAGCAALDAKRGTLAGLADAGHHAVVQQRAQGLAEPDRGGGLAFTQRGRRDGGHIDVFAVRDILQAIQHFQFNFGLIRAVKFDFLREKSQFLGNLRNRFNIRFLRDLDIGWNGLAQLQRGRCKRTPG